MPLPARQKAAVRSYDGHGAFSRTHGPRRPARPELPPQGRRLHTVTDKQVRAIDRVIIRFAGDSGDGMQLTGDRFTAETASFGNDLST
ncbi:MAG: hypothetical protein ACREIV_14290, partial [Planctomycetaceae bacterium]